jgi:hypothetical protein
MATSPLFGWEEPDDTDLVKDGAAAIRTLGNAIDTSMGDLLGGTTGQILSKNSNTNMDFTWVTSDDANAIQNAIVDAKGDLIGATAADTPARLAVGTNGQVLTADSTAATGLAWATPSSGASFVGCIAYNNAAQTYTSTATVVTFPSEEVDTNTFHSTVTNTGRMTIPSGKDGKYLMTLTTQLDSTTAPFRVFAYKNGAAIANGLTSGGLEYVGTTGSTFLGLTTGIVVTGVATDYFEFLISSGAGSAQTQSARYSFVYLGA